MSAIDALFDPKSIAVIGASEDPARVGSETVRALRDNGYAGAVYPVNPKYATIFGFRCYASLEEIEGGIDLAVIAIPAAAVPAAIAACAAKKVRYAAVLSGGFAETGERGAALQAEIVRIAREGGVRVIGPNCLGFANLPRNVFACFGSITREPKLPRGSVSLVTQSGGFGYTIALECARHGIGFDTIATTGNEADVDCVELIDALVADAPTSAVVAYMEGVRDGRAFVRAGRNAARAGKPLLVWKGGATRGGARAAASHTANMVGVYDFFRAAFRAAGAIEIADVHDAVDLLKGLRSRTLPAGRRFAVMGGSGGSAIVFTDAIERNGCELAQLTDPTLATLRELLPSIGSVGNPIDFTAGFIAQHGAAKYAQAVRAVANDPAVDALCFTLATIGAKGARQAGEVIAEVAKEVAKPFFVFMALAAADAPDAHAIFEAARIPVFASPARAGRTIAALADFAERRARILAQGSEPAAPSARVALPPVPFALTERESKAVLDAAGIATTRDRFYPPDERPALEGLGAHVVLKVVSRDIPHKTEVGGVRVGVPREELARAAAEMLEGVCARAPGARIDGVLVAEQVQGGFELLLGTVRDPAFGPVVVLGIGGIYAEALRDRVCRLAPVDVEEARGMIDELACAAILRGARGEPPYDVDALARAVSALSQLAWDARDAIAEIDVNPLFVLRAGRGVLAADALIVGAA